MNSSLSSNVKVATNVKKLGFGPGAIASLKEIIERRKAAKGSGVVALVDEVFNGKSALVTSLPLGDDDQLIFVSTAKEPTTALVDKLKGEVLEKFEQSPSAIIGIGGGSTLDCAKAVSNLLTNPGKAADYQGWDLVRQEGVYKVGVPTLSGTGAEATRTCVMTNPESGVKLGMNSDFSVFDEVVLDPDLTATVPKNQYFFSGMDA